MKSTVVIFKEHTARILMGVDPKDYEGRSDCLIDPGIPLGVPPHHWKMQNGSIGLHDAHVIEQREAELFTEPVKYKEPKQAPVLLQQVTEVSHSEPTIQTETVQTVSNWKRYVEVILISALTSGACQYLAKLLHY